MQNFIDIILKIRQNIYQFEKHNSVLIMFESIFENRFSFIFAFDTNFVKNVSNI